LRLSLGLSLKRRASGAFTPATVSPTAWYDPSDLTTLWKDTAGTDPVTADGDAVARIDDKSGNGYHWLQATAANRPLYKTAGGLHWLLFDGVNDALTAGSTSFGSSMDFCIAMQNSSADTLFVTAYSGGSPYIGVVQDGNASGTSDNAGTPADYVNGVAVSPANRDGLHDALGSTAAVLQIRLFSRSGVPT
jgi:hypothetical protein